MVLLNCKEARVAMDPLISETVTLSIIELTKSKP